MALPPKMKQVKTDVGNTWWGRTHGFGVLTFAHTLGYLCKSSWQSARPHYLSANRGHAERQGKTLKRKESWVGGGRSREEVDPLSAEVLCRLVEQILLWPPAPQTPRVGPGHHLASTEPPLMDTAGRDTCWQIFYGKTEMEIPPVASTPGVPQSRAAFAKKGGDSGTRRQKNN